MANDNEQSEQEQHPLVTALIQQRNEAQNANAQLSAQVQMLSQQLTAVMQERDDLKSRLEGEQPAKKGGKQAK